VVLADDRKPRILKEETQLPPATPPPLCYFFSLFLCSDALGLSVVGICLSLLRSVVYQIFSAKKEKKGGGKNIARNNLTLALCLPFPCIRGKVRLQSMMWVRGEPLSGPDKPHRILYNTILCGPPTGLPEGVLLLSLVFSLPSTRTSKSLRISRQVRVESVGGLQSRLTS